MVEKDSKLIPKGDYCYRREKVKTGKATKIIKCPYWKKRTRHKGKKVHPQENGYCSFMEMGDIELNIEYNKEGAFVYRCKKGEVISAHAYAPDEIPDWLQRRSLLWDMVKECGLNEKS